MSRGLNLRFVGAFGYEASINPLHYSDTMTVKLLSTDCVNLDSLILRLFDSSYRDSLKNILGRNKVRSNAIVLLNESNNYNLA